MSIITNFKHQKSVLIFFSSKGFLISTKRHVKSFVKEFLLLLGGFRKFRASLSLSFQVLQIIYNKNTTFFSFHITKRLHNLLHSLIKSSLFALQRFLSSSALCCHCNHLLKHRCRTTCFWFTFHLSITSTPKKYLHKIVRKLSKKIFLFKYLHTTHAWTT